MRISSLFFLLFFALSAQAAQIAMVKSEIAVVYADPDLTTPLGKLSKGKRLYVGEVPKKKGTLLPLVYRGKVAWIQIKDLEIFPRSLRKNLRFEHDFEVPESINIEDNLFFHISLHVSFFSLLTFKTTNNPKGSDSAPTLENEKKAGTAFSLITGRRNSRHKFYALAGIDYLNIQSSSATYQTLALKIQLSRILLSTSFLRLEAFAGPWGSLTFQVDIERLNNRHRGTFYGLEYGLMGRLFPRKRFSFLFGASGLWLKFIGLEEISSPKTPITTTFESLTGMRFFAGLNYSF